MKAQVAGPLLRLNFTLDTAAHQSHESDFPQSVRVANAGALCPKPTYFGTRGYGATVSNANTRRIRAMSFTFAETSVAPCSRQV